MLLKEINLSWNEINYEISFNTIQKMIMDLPQYESDDDDDDTDDYPELKEQSTEEFINSMNAFRL